MTKPQTEVLFEVNQDLKGNEPFLNFSQPHMIVNLSVIGRSHNFFEGRVNLWSRLKKGDKLVFQLCRVSQVEIPEPWWKKIWNSVCR